MSSRREGHFMKKMFQCVFTLVGCVAFFSMFSTSKPAQASSFSYYANDGTKVLHKSVMNYQKYSLNKSYSIAFHSKANLYNLYVYHVSLKNSRYQTWVKLTGRIYNNSGDTSDAGHVIFGTSTMTGISRKYVMQLTNSTKTNFAFSPSTSYAPLLLDSDPVTGGLLTGKSEGFQLLMHSKAKTTKLGKTQMVVCAISSGGSTYKQFSLNLK